jgi:uncharacterized protein (TIGR00730 family)
LVQGPRDAANDDDVCVYCASSRQADPAFGDSARRLGGLLASLRRVVVYGGGATGSMGALADGALAAAGRVIGVLPRFMRDLEWAHPAVEMRVVADMHERKRTMLELSGSVVALPGGCGTFEELLEAMAWKRLGLWNGPIVIVNERGFYDPLRTLLDGAIGERFMDARHAALWTLVASVDAVPEALRFSPPWDRDAARGFAVP